MIGVIVAAHGNLAESLVSTSTSVVSDPGLILTVSIRPDDDSSSYEQRFRQAVKEILTTCDGVLVLTDMFGGSPSNISMTLHQVGKVEVLTGVNLPMLIKVLQLNKRNLDLQTIAQQAKESGARAIAIASEVLCGPTTEQKG